ncbi:hypothetical protein APR12_006240 [Nocardia amikacinitolerans]|uniref:hypothetical protein n=1 Tax=Nocardia amikacinitolerans TaxID=756689 RepID=UPI000834D8FF|nr:hypothetical protein [Nocardia amikacinitolerans]MCP2320850.1 hypothetical protein [Nocardia amikacinitolerans]
MVEIDDGMWPNHKKVWTAHHYRIIIEALRNGLSWEDAARGVGRKLGATRARAGFLIDDDDDIGNPGRRRRKAWERLQDRIAVDPEHDWEAIARAKHAEAELAYWDEAGEELLQQVWESAVPARDWRGRPKRAASDARIRSLVAQLGIHEADIADRLVELGLATSYAEIADRLGATPDGALDARARLARVDRAAALYVLVLADEFGAIRHTSLHANRADAEHARDAVQRRKEFQGPMTTRIVRRIIGRLWGTDPDDDELSVADPTSDESVYTAGPEKPSPQTARPRHWDEIPDVSLLLEEE